MRVLVVLRHWSGRDGRWSRQPAHIRTGGRDSWHDLACGGAIPGRVLREGDTWNHGWCEYRYPLNGSAWTALNLYEVCPACLMATLAGNAQIDWASADDALAEWVP